MKLFQLSASKSISFQGVVCEMLFQGGYLCDVYIYILHTHLNISIYIYKYLCMCKYMYIYMYNTNISNMYIYMLANIWGEDNHVRHYSPKYYASIYIFIYAYTYINTVYEKINTSLHIHIWTCKKQRFLSMAMSSYRKSSVSTLYGPKNWEHPKLHPQTLTWIAKMMVWKRQLL